MILPCGVGNGITRRLHILADTVDRVARRYQQCACENDHSNQFAHVTLLKTGPGGESHDRIANAQGTASFRAARHVRSMMLNEIRPENVTGGGGWTPSGLFVDRESGGA